MAKRAIVIQDGDRDPAHDNIARILDFFGVPWDSVLAQEMHDRGRSFDDAVLIGRIDDLATAFTPEQARDRWPASVFAFVGSNLVKAKRVLQLLLGDPDASIAPLADGEHRFCISRAADCVGPMAGLEFSALAGKGNSILTGSAVPDDPGCTVLITVDGSAAFVKLAIAATSIYISGNAQIVDIDEPVDAGYYDVKKHFLAAAPLVMFVRSVFQDTAWQEQELGACLIVDDPLLKPRYGKCDFRSLRHAMQRHNFTTNIAFIPWNWRRTSQSAARFFREAEPFSVSIHGCDHTKGEFGDTSIAGLQEKASLAMGRMKGHEARTGIRHDRIMVFPQGVFSSVCPEVLKENGYIAAVNTEINPIDVEGGRTLVRDVWDVAITRYGNFPIFTRRYEHHGLENFAFDLLLGKPCLIVTHHEVFKNDCNTVIRLIEKLNKLNCSLHWRSLGKAVQRACRLRRDETGRLEVQMYGAELLVTNTSDEGVNVVVRKRESDADCIACVQCNSKPAACTCEGAWNVVRRQIEPHGELQIKVEYGSNAPARKVDRAFKLEVSVALRRAFSELRDEYLA